MNLITPLLAFVFAGTVESPPVPGPKPNVKYEHKWEDPYIPQVELSDAVLRAERNGWFCLYFSQFNKAKREKEMLKYKDDLLAVQELMLYNWLLYFNPGDFMPDSSRQLLPYPDLQRERHGEVVKDKLKELIQKRTEEGVTAALVRYHYCEFRPDVEKADKKKSENKNVGCFPQLKLGKKTQKITRKCAHDLVRDYLLDYNKGFWYNIKKLYTNKDLLNFDNKMLQMESSIVVHDSDLLMCVESIYRIFTTGDEEKWTLKPVEVDGKTIQLIGELDKDFLNNKNWGVFSEFPRYTMDPVLDRERIKFELSKLTKINQVICK